MLLLNNFTDKFLICISPFSNSKNILLSFIFPKSESVFLLEILSLPLKLFPSFHDEDKIMPSCFCLLFDNYNDNIRLKLLKNNIFCRKYYHPLIETKNTVNIYNKILCLPCTVDMTEKNIDLIIKLIK